jgi:hypothetical protein
MQPRVVQEKEGFMATLDERFQKGLEMRERLAGGQGRIFRGAVPVAYELAWTSGIVPLPHSP